MIGPGKFAGEGLTRRLNCQQWMEENRERPLTQAEHTVFCVLHCTMLGVVGAIGRVQGLQVADCGPSL